ncbi:MAG TPA: hypothetical protein DGT23_19550 [Micromonosporaceae bacterium]|nr:hypothetical protein [Micromonosporaceae bacterium]
MDVFVIDPSKVRDIAPDVLDTDGRLRVMPAAYWATTTPEERQLFGHQHGLYSFPTTELVDHLRALIGDRTAIEISAGHGVLAEALGIPATDSRQQDKEPYRSIYLASGQPTVPYGPNVIDCHASRAVRQYKPQVVIGCWITHKYDPANHAARGNEAGVDEPDILRNCETYVVIGNQRVHELKPLWTRPHTIEYPPFVYSRAQNGTPDFIAIWRGIRATA